MEGPEGAGEPRRPFRPFGGDRSQRPEGPARPDRREFPGRPQRPFGNDSFSASSGGSSRRPPGRYEGDRPERPQARRADERVPRGHREGRIARIERQDRPAEIPTTPPQLAGRIVEKANVRQPADLLLRQTLARRRGLTPDQAAWISRAVFAYFRWQQWLDAARPIEDRLQQAITLADRFAKEADWPAPAELASHAVPAWTASAMPVDPAWLRSLQSEAPLWLRVAPGALEVVQEELGADGALSAGPLPDSLRYAGREDLFLSHAFQDGLIEIQDLASQAVGHVCAPQPGETWWDACAGEGGKTLHLSALMKGQGLIWASDRADWRLDRLKQRAARAHCFNHRRVAWDGGAKPPTRTSFDGVLVDAPCSGIGTWARNPHARWTTTPEDTQELAAIQRSLLDNVVSSVKPGGRLVYAVCTLSTAETVDVAKAFSEKHPEFEPCPFANPVDPSAAPAAVLTLWPQATAGNGMFIAAWRRKPVAEREPAAAPAA